MIRNVMENFLVFIVQLAYIILGVFQWMIIVWVVASWLVLLGILSPTRGIFALVTDAVSPVLRPFRWARWGMMDFSPVVAVLVIDALMRILDGGSLW